MIRRHCQSQGRLSNRRFAEVSVTTIGNGSLLEGLHGDGPVCRPGTTRTPWRGGVGRRPLTGFNQVGSEVHCDETGPAIRPVLEGLVAGKPPPMADDQVCGDGGRRG